MKFVAKVAASFLLVIILCGLGLYLSLPTAKEIRGCLTTKMYGVNLCPGSKDYVPLKNISRYMQRAVILTEDGNFFRHDGFDWESIEKSAKENLEKGKYKRGGSTITQQLAKNMFLSKDKTLWRKGIEAIITNRLEKHLTKKEILERYLNVVEFGKDIYGIKEAANYYFQKQPSGLGILESAFLAMVLPSPTKYSRSYQKKELTPFARKRIQRIVTDMRRSGLISDGEYQSALGSMTWFFGSPPPAPPEGGEEGEELDEEYYDDSTSTNTNFDREQHEALQKLNEMEIDATPLIDEPTLDPNHRPSPDDDGSNN